MIQKASSKEGPWGEYIPNVINVGAWNVDQNGYALASNKNYIDTVDVFADGYIAKDGWQGVGHGWSFGTSFATPRVTAEIVNFANEYLTPIILDPDFVPPNNEQPLTNEEITNVTNGIVDEISTDVNVLFNGLMSVSYVLLCLFKATFL